MSTINLGNQYLTFDYKHPFKAADFNTLLRGGLTPGIYSGGLISKIDNATVSIAPFVAFMDVGSDKLLRVETRSAITLEGVTSANPIIYMTYAWSEQIENWVDFAFRKDTDPPVTNELILGEAHYESVNLQEVLYTKRTLGLTPRVANTERELINTVFGLSGDAEGVYILKGGEATHNSGSTIDIAECYAITIDSDGSYRVIYTPEQTALEIPSGWNDGRQIWVVGDYKKAGSYTKNNLLVDVDPGTGVVCLDSFYINGSTYVAQTGRSDVLQPRTDSVAMTHLTPDLRDFLNNITPQDVNNYITNGIFETGVDGWTNYKNTPAGAQPITGTGGSPTIALGRNAVNPLFGTYNALLSKSAANKQGEGVSTDFNIDVALQGKNIEISFYYRTGLDYASEDVGIYIYDKTNANIIVPSLVNIAPSTSPNKFIAKFATASNSTSYRLCFHIATTSTAAWTLEFDNVSVKDSESMIADIIKSPQKAGFIQEYAGITAPTGWDFCDGGYLSKTTYTDLWTNLHSNKGAVAITAASPGVVTLATHGLETGHCVVFSTIATVTGLSIDTNYYVIKNDANTFWLATSLANAEAGTKINTGGSNGTANMDFVPWGIYDATNFYKPNFSGFVPKGIGSQAINGRTKTGPVLGAEQEDQMQGHHINVQSNWSDNTAGSVAIMGSASSVSGSIDAGVIITDGTNGDPRIGATTRENSVGINFIIKLYDDVQNVQVVNSNISPAKAGFLVDYTGQTIPAGYELADGGLLAIVDYPALYANIGTQYNVGGEAAGYFRKPNYLSVALEKGGYSNLVVMNNAGTPNSKVDVDCDVIKIAGKVHYNVNLTLDITASGALGLDTGTESADAWYYIWLLSKLDGTLTGVLSASATTPTLPTGYIFSKLVGAVRNTSGDFVVFIQTDNYVEINTKQILPGGGSATYAAIDCTIFYPVTAKKIIGWLDIGTTGSNVYVYLSNTGTLDTYVYRIQTVPEYHPFYINIKNTTIYYKTTNDVVSIYLTGYELNI